MKPRRVGDLLDIAVARGAIVVGLVERAATHPTARRAVLAVAAIGAVIAASSLASTTPVQPCRIAGHARTTTVECDGR